MTTDAIMSIEELDVEADLAQRRVVREIKRARRKARRARKAGKSTKKKYDDAKRRVINKYPWFMAHGSYTTYHVDDAWLEKHAAHLKHISFWRHVDEKDLERVDQTSKVRIPYGAKINEPIL